MLRISLCSSSLLFLPVAVTYGETNVNGINYKLNAEMQTAKVTDNRSCTMEDIDIPDRITVDGKTYAVTSIEDDAFAYNQHILSIKLPASVTEMG